MTAAFSIGAAVLAAALTLPCSAADSVGVCASTLQEVRVLLVRPHAPLTWQETTMSDGKPLTLRLSEREGRLFARFDKEREGLWAEGVATLCAAQGRLQATLASEHIRVGPAAHWLLRQSLRNGASFSLSRLEGGALRITTAGWGGDFAALPPDRAP